MDRQHLNLLAQRRFDQNGFDDIVREWLSRARSLREQLSIRRIEAQHALLLAVGMEQPRRTILRLFKDSQRLGFESMESELAQVTLVRSTLRNRGLQHDQALNERLETLLERLDVTLRELRHLRREAVSELGRR